MRKILAAKPSITQLEIDYVTDAVTNGWGEDCYKYLNSFKSCLKNYFNAEYICPTSSCHGALHIVLMALGINNGDEVIVPDATWVGSVFPISWLGATPIFVDVLPGTWCIDPKKVEQSITDKTKAIIAVHLYGNLCEMDELLAIGQRHGIPVIEDAAEAIGSEYKGMKAGSLADFGVYSFHGTKTVTTGEGGAIISQRSDFYEQLTTIESQGRTPEAKTFWVDEIGLKYKMSNIQAALGLAQFERIKDIVARKREVFFQYKNRLSEFADIELNAEQPYAKNSYWMPTIVFGDSWKIDCEKVIEYLNAAGIAVRPFFYRVSQFPMYKGLTLNDTPVSERLSHRGINLPNYYDMAETDIALVVTKLKEALNVFQSQR